VALVVAVLTRDGFGGDRQARDDLEVGSWKHFYVRESVCAYLRCHNNCLLCEPGKDGSLVKG
jgi:hypothetical protein